jgi:hypothetical protein
MSRGDSHDDERPGWREPDDDEPREWEIEPEEEREDTRPVLGGTAPMARLVFLVILGLVVLGAAAALIESMGAGFFR